MSLPHLWENDNEKMLLIAMMAAGPVACTTSPAPKEDTKLKDAYSACINTAEGNPDKIEACQSVLNVLKRINSTSSSPTESVRVRITNSAFRPPAPATIRR